MTCFLNWGSIYLLYKEIVESSAGIKHVAKFFGAIVVSNITSGFLKNLKREK